MELGRPLAVVTPTLDGEVLALLAGSGASFTTGQVRRILTGFSEEGIRRVLGRLTRQGVVSRERVGQAFVYRLNTDHLAAGPIVELANLQQALISRLEQRLADWPFPPVFASLFGSAARGSMSESSDLDLLVVRADEVPRADWDEQIAAFADDVSRWTGNDARVIEFSVSEIEGARHEPVLADVLAEGLTLAGERTWLARHLRPSGV